MNINDQLCTLAQAKRLQELGIEQRKGIFEWCVFMPDPLGERWFYAPVYFQEEIEQQLYEWIASAFTVAELGVMLPDLLETTIHQYELICIKEDDCWLCIYCRANNILDHLPEIKSVGGTTESESRANMLIKLLEYKFTTPEECNKRLQG